MAVSRRTLSILALMGLLVQGAFGAVSPAAVLCISSHSGDHADDRPAAGESITSCDLHRCCAPALPAALTDPGGQDERSEDDRVRIALAPPCDDGCLDCVDVALPDDVPAQELRACGVELVHLLTVHVGHRLWAVGIRPPASLPMATGPPDASGGVERAIIRTTRLLI